MGEEKKWHKQQESILKTWGEQSACYRYMHFKEYQRYKKSNMNFTLPIIILSTLTGTANMAQETFPDSWSKYVPIGIGGLNLIAAIMTTVLQFLKITELMESHRVSSVHYGKLSRSIRLQLTLPRYERSHNGSEFVDFCNQEYDRLIEQSPAVNGKVLKTFEKEYPEMRPPPTPRSSKNNRGCLSYLCCKEEIDTKDKDLQLARPEIMKLSPINVYDNSFELKTVSKVKFKPPTVIKPTIAELKNVFSRKNIELQHVAESATAPAPAPAPAPVPAPAPDPVVPEPTPASLLDDTEIAVTDEYFTDEEEAEAEVEDEQPSVATRVANLQQKLGDSPV